MVATNTVLKDLDLSSNNWGYFLNLKGDGPGFAQQLAVGISNNGALTSLNLARNSIGGYLDDASAFIACPEGISSHTQSCSTYPTRTIFSYYYRC
jgi:hypothetical protein